MTSTRNWQIYLIPLCVFVILSAVLCLLVPLRDAHFELDSYSYQRVADYFFTHGQLRDPHCLDQMPVYPVGYPLFMGLLYMLFGIRIYVLFCAQIILACISMLLAGSIARTMFSESVARYTRYALSVHVGLLVYAQLIMSELLVMTLIMGMFERMAQFYTTRHERYMYQAAVLLGLSLTVKSIALLFVPLFLLHSFLIMSAWRSLLVASLCAVPVVLCACYNYTQYGNFQLSPQFHVNVYHYFLPKLIARVDGISESQAQARVISQGATAALVYRYFKLDPCGCLVIWGVNMAKTWFGLFTTQLKIILNPVLRGGACAYARVSNGTAQSLYTYIAYGASAWWVVLLGLLEFLILMARTLLVLIGLCAFNRAYRPLALMMISFIALCLLITGFDGCFRFRMVYEPLLVMYAVAGTVQSINAVRRWCALRVVGIS